MAESAEAILWDVVEEHVDEAEFLAELLASAHDSPVYTFDEVREGPEERLRAHLDALAVGGSTVFEQTLLPTVTGDEDLGDEPTLYRVAGAALAILCGAEPAWATAMLDRLPEVPDEHFEGVVHALAICDAPDIDARLPKLVARAEGTGAAFHVRGLDLGDALEGLLRSADPQLRAAAFRAAQYTDRRRLSWIEHGCTSADPELRDAALPAGLVMGSANAWQITGRLAQSSTELHRGAMQWVAQFGEPRTLQLIVDRLDDEATRNDALWALGFSGRIEAAEACLGWLADGAAGPLAGEAFAGITGLDPVDDAYWGSPPPDEGDEEPPPLDEDLDEDLSVSPEEELPVPNVEAINAWWAENRGRFQSGQRYILGRPADQQSLLHALRTESMRRRHARAFELLVRSKGQARVQTRMMSGAQQRQMDALGALPRIDGNRPFSRL